MTHAPAHKKAHPALPRELDLIIEGIKKEIPQTLSHETKESIYAYFYQCYEQGHYQDAVSGFRLLATVDMKNPRYWLSMAASHQMLKEYEEAITSYAMTALLSEKDPFPHLHAAECFFSLHQLPSALSALDEAEKLAKNQEKYNNVISQVNILRKTWKETKGN